MATKWGIVSAGRISHDFVSCLRSLPAADHQIVAVAAKDLERAKKFSQLHHISKVYGSYEELAKDPDVEVVYVGVINPVHGFVGQLMLEAGKHVLMEKPMTMTLKGTQNLNRIAQQKKVFLMEAMWSRFMPSFQQMMKEIAAGTIGDVVYAYASFGSVSSGVDRAIRKSLGGSVTLNIGIYAINAVSMVFGGEKPLKISAIGNVNEEGVDTAVTASLQYGKRRSAQIVWSLHVDLPNELIVTGTKGTLKLSNPMWCATQLVTPNRSYDFPLPDTAEPCNFINSSGLRYEAMEVRRCTKAGLLESQTMTHEDAELLAYIMGEIHSQLGVHFEEGV